MFLSLSLQGLGLIRSKQGRLSATPATPATPATAAKTMYSATTTFFELDKEHDLLLGNYEHFTLKMSNAKKILLRSREKEKKLRKKSLFWTI